MPEIFYYSHGGKGPGIARIIEINDQFVEFEIKSNVKSKRWSYARLSKTAWSRSGWKQRTGQAQA